MEVIIIVASTKNHVIGKDNDLIWHLPVDMKFFKETTKGYPVIMGRKNFESIPQKYRPLPGRKNIVLSRQSDYDAGPDVPVCTELKEALIIAEKEGKEKAFVIGGGQIYSTALEQGLVDKMLITWLDIELDGDAFFPSFDESKWETENLMHYPADEKHAYAFEILEYRKSILKAVSLYSIMLKSVLCLIFFCLFSFAEYSGQSLRPGILAYGGGLEGIDFSDRAGGGIGVLVEYKPKLYRISYTVELKTLFDDQEYLGLILPLYAQLKLGEKKWTPCISFGGTRYLSEEKDNDIPWSFMLGLSLEHETKNLFWCPTFRLESVSKTETNYGKVPGSGKFVTETRIPLITLGIQLKFKLQTAMANTPESKSL